MNFTKNDFMPVSREKDHVWILSLDESSNAFEINLSVVSFAMMNVVAENSKLRGGAQRRRYQNDEEQEEAREHGRMLGEQGGAVKAALETAS
jgi:hypothetical protein